MGFAGEYSGYNRLDRDAGQRRDSAACGVRRCLARAYTRQSHAITRPNSNGRQQATRYILSTESYCTWNSECACFPGLCFKLQVSSTETTRLGQSGRLRIFYDPYSVRAILRPGPIVELCQHTRRVLRVYGVLGGDSALLSSTQYSLTQYSLTLPPPGGHRLLSSWQRWKGTLGDHPDDFTVEDRPAWPIPDFRLQASSLQIGASFGLVKLIHDKQNA